jgi:hypothetical protein
VCDDLAEKVTPKRLQKATERTNPNATGTLEDLFFSWQPSHSAGISEVFALWSTDADCECSRALPGLAEDGTAGSVWTSAKCACAASVAAAEGRSAIRPTPVMLADSSP